MINGLIGKKLGMTQIFDDKGNAVPVTVLQVGPCVVVQKKTADRDGYNAIQVGLVESGRRLPKANRPAEGHFKRAGVPPTRVLKEFTQVRGSDPVEVGDTIVADDVFDVNEFVDVRGRTIGRGFQGVMKRHGHHGGRATHGSMFHRAPGSIGASAHPSRVYPGMKLPGRMGARNRTTLRLRVVKVDSDNNLLLVKGSVPGSKGGYVIIHRSS
ncbi:MAG TPA: 50S ribosomal protein L3 [Acidobacteriota bacterium]|nr:50S ribosomal protein L3 [Acidobacteriota bacterium]